jgi:hypothetical protein
MRRKPPKRATIVDRRRNPRGGRRADDNREERELRIQQMVEYLRRQNPQSAFEVPSIQGDKSRKA